MIWQARIGTSGNWTDMPTPSSYKIEWEDLDNNSYRSVVNGNLVRRVVSRHWMKIGFTYNFISASNLSTVASMVNQSGLMIRAKTPAFGTTTNPAGWIECKGYVSKFQAELLEGQVGYSLTFNFVQSTKVTGQ